MQAVQFVTKLAHVEHGEVHASQVLVAAFAIVVLTGHEPRQSAFSLKKPDAHCRQFVAEPLQVWHGDWQAEHCCGETEASAKNWLGQALRHVAL